jgi:hypothetical protein
VGDALRHPPAASIYAYQEIVLNSSRNRWEIVNNLKAMSSKLIKKESGGTTGTTQATAGVCSLSGRCGQADLSYNYCKN